jgi:hypothetical protein
MWPTFSNILDHPVIEIPPRLSQVALEILRIGKAENDFDSFVSASILKPVGAGVTHSDRMRVLESLLNEGCLRLEGGKFFSDTGHVPSWLIDGVAEGFVEAEEVANELLESPDQRKKFDAEILAQIGLKGEQAFVRALREHLPASATINHVSLFDDTLGYDVEISAPGARRLCFEVKTTSRNSREFGFFLSRNEANVASGLGENWLLGLVQIKEGVASVLGTSPSGSILSKLPQDKSADVRWASISCSLEFSGLQPLEVSLKGVLTQDS